MPKSTRTSAFWFCMPHSYAVRILVVNVNTTASMTDAIAASARSVAAPGTEIVPLTPDIGADSVEGNFESYLAAVAVMDAVTRYPDPFDAVIQAGFGEHGREGLQELLDVPVVDITEAAAHVACLLGHKYSVVTTLDRDGAAHRGPPEARGPRHAVRLGALQRALGAGARARTGTLAVEAIIRRGRARRARGQGRGRSAWAAAAWPGWTRRCALQTGVPVVDGVTAAVKLAEGLVALGLSTSKVRTYASPRPKRIVGWPLLR